MKKLLYLIILLLPLFAGCKNEEAPTVFKGKVIYSDGEPYRQGDLLISGIETNQPISIGEDIKIVESIDLGQSNKFDITFNDEDISFFVFKIYDRTLLDGFRAENGLDCGDAPCNSITPGKVYDNLVITVPR